VRWSRGASAVIKGAQGEGLGHAGRQFGQAMPHDAPKVGALGEGGGVTPVFGRLLPVTASLKPGIQVIRLHFGIRAASGPKAIKDFSP
jgi:hypothetical protein